MTLSDYQIINWENNYVINGGGDTNEPAATASMAGNLDANLRMIKSVVRDESMKKQFERWGITATYISATEFTLPGKYDATNTDSTGLPLGPALVNRRIRAIVNAGTVQGTIVSASYNGSVTTVTLKMDGSEELDSGLSEVMFGADTDQNGAVLATLWKQNVTPPVFAKIANGGSGAAFTDGNSGAIAMFPAPAAYQTDQLYIFQFDQASQGSDTVNINSLGAVSFQSNGSGLIAGQVAAGTYVFCMYDGTYMQVVASATSTSQQGTAGLGTQALDSDLTTVIGDSDTVVDTQDLTMPTTGGPWRIVATYYLPGTASEALRVGVHVSDGTNIWGDGEFQPAVIVAGSGLQYLSSFPQATDISPVTYANGASVTVTLHAKTAASSYTLGTDQIYTRPAFFRTQLIPSN